MLLPCVLAAQQPALGRRAALFNFACAGAALLAPPRAEAEVDVLGSYKLVEILTDAKDLGERPGFPERLVGALSERARDRAD